MDLMQVPLEDFRVMEGRLTVVKGPSWVSVGKSPLKLQYEPQTVGVKDSYWGPKRRTRP